MDILTLGKISAVKRETDAKIDALDKTITENIAITTETFDEHLTTAVSDLTTDLNDATTLLNASMDTLDTTLTSCMATLDSNTNTDLTALTAQLNSDLSSAISTVNTNLSNTENQLNTSMNALDTSLTSDINSLSSTVATNNSWDVTCSGTLNSKIDTACSNLGGTVAACHTCAKCCADGKNASMQSCVGTISSCTSGCLAAASTTMSNCHTCAKCCACAYATDLGGTTYGTQWIYNCCGMKCSRCGNCNAGQGKCCNWTVPTGISRVQFEIWSAGGSGAGGCNYYCCMTSMNGGAGGNYATKTIDVSPGWTYTTCAGDTYRCCAHTWGGGRGCKSWVSGCNISMCAFGGCGGRICNCGAWGWQQRETCLSTDGTGFCGADFGMMGTTGVGHSNSGCHCYSHNNTAGSAPMIGMESMNTATETWCSCACHTNWPSGGGMNGESTYCGNHAKCCAVGNMGGSGVVRITYLG